MWGGTATLRIALCAPTHLTDGSTKNSDVQSGVDLVCTAGAPASRSSRQGSSARGTAGMDGAADLDTDDEDDAGFEQWKLRELRRIGRDRCTRHALRGDRPVASPHAVCCPLPPAQA